MPKAQRITRSRAGKKNILLLTSEPSDKTTFAATNMVIVLGAKID